MAKLFNIENERQADKLLEDIIEISKRFNLKDYEPSAYELHTLESCYQLLKSMLKE